MPTWKYASHTFAKCGVGRGEVVRVVVVDVVWGGVVTGGCGVVGWCGVSDGDGATMYIKDHTLYLKRLDI